MNTIAERLRIARDERGLSQAGLASIIGVSRGVIANIETGVTEPQKIVVNAICESLNVEFEWLMNGKGNMRMSGDRKLLIAKLNELAATMTDEQIWFLIDMVDSMERRFGPQKQEPTRRPLNEITADAEARKQSKPPGRTPGDIDRGR